MAKKSKGIALLLLLVLLLILISSRMTPREALRPNAPTVTDDPLPSETPAPEETPEPTPEPTPDPEAEALAAAEAARAKLDAGDYYAAALDAKACMEGYPDSEAAGACQEILDDIRSALADKEPKTGELERHFQYQGGNEVHAMALSGPLEMTITDKDHPEHFVRFYVRQGNVSEIYLPAGDYIVSYKLGEIWFGDDIGFGDLCRSVTYDDYLEFHTKQDNAWITNYSWSPIF